MKAIQINIYKAVCILIILTVVGIRLHRANIAFERDEGEYAYAGQMILKGHPPYQEVYNMKFPGAYYLYAASFKLFGEDVSAPRYMVLLLQLAGAGFLFLLGRLLINQLAGWLCATGYLLFNLSIAMQGLQSNIELFLTPFFIASLYFLYRANERNSLPDIFIAGILISMALIMKQQSVVFAIASFLWIAYVWRAEMLRYVVVCMAGIVVPVLLMFSYLWHCGVWDQFYFLTFKYARAYVGLSTMPHIDVNTLFSIWNKEPVIASCFLIGIAGLFYPTANFKARYFMIIFFIASVAALSVGFYFRPHYYVYIVPILSLLLAYSLFQFTVNIPQQIRVSILSLSVAAMAFIFLYTNKECFFSMSAENVTEQIYPNTPFNACGEIARYIKQQTQPDDRICMVGAEPQIFFLSQRRSASGYIYVYPLLEPQKYAEQMTNEFISKSEQNKPAILLFSSKSVFEDGANQNTRLYQWYTQFKSNYKLAAVCYAPNGHSRMNIFDTITPVDTLSVETPQIKVYKRIER